MRKKDNVKKDTVKSNVTEITAGTMEQQERVPGKIR